MIHNGVQQDVDKSGCVYIIYNKCYAWTDSSEFSDKCILDIYSSLQYTYLYNKVFDYANPEIPMILSMPCWITKNSTLE